jgi:hypothetical protein
MQDDSGGLLGSGMSRFCAARCRAMVALETVDQGGAAQRAQGVLQGRVGADDDGPKLVDRLGAGLDREGPGQSEDAQHLHRPVAGLGGAGGPRG